MIRWEPEILADGLGFPEGPIYEGNGVVVFTEIEGQKLSRYEKGKVETIVATGGGANGATPDGKGNYYITNNGGLSAGPKGQWRAEPLINGKIQKVTADGKISDLDLDLPGDKPHRPNDLCFGPDGQLYFTDPHNWEDFRNLKPGRVNRTDLKGNVEQLAEVKRFPNGIGFGTDGRLYVAETFIKHVWVYTWNEKGLGEAKVFCVLPAGYPDGFCFSSSGDLIVTGSGGDLICVYGPDGKLAKRFDSGTGTSPTNCCLGDGKLYVTYSGTGQLVAFDCDLEAFPLYKAK